MYLYICTNTHIFEFAYMFTVIALICIARTPFPDGHPRHLGGLRWFKALIEPVKQLILVAKNHHCDGDIPDLVG
jgi:hypothetical protein